MRSGAARVSLLTALLAGLCLTVLLAPATSRARLARALPPALPIDSGQVPGARGIPVWVAGLGLGCLVAVVVGSWTGVGLGAVAAAVVVRLLPGLGDQGDRARRAVEQDLPLALDLLAACLAGGASPAAALTAVAGAVPGPLGARLSHVSARLLAGAPPAEAWDALAGGTDGPAADAARALARTSLSGAPVADAVAGVAAEAALAAAARAQARARRAGVLVVLPLGLCFLPAFVLIGVVPVVVGLLGPLLDAG